MRTRILGLEAVKRRARGRVVVLGMSEQFSEHVIGVFRSPEEAFRHLPEENTLNRHFWIVLTRMGRKRAQWWHKLPVERKAWFQPAR